MEEVRHDHEVAIGSELIGNELSVDESMANHVGEYQDGILGGLVRGIGKVGLNCVRGISQD